MAITTYAELQTAIADWSHRSDLTAKIIDFITFTEAKLNRDGDFRLMEMEGRFTADITTEYFTLPDDFLEARSLQVNTANGSFGLNYCTPTAFNSIYGSASTSQPTSYTIIGDEVRLGLAPDGTYEVELVYYAKIPALSDTNTTNWLLTAWPDLYLNGALAELYQYTRDKEGILLSKGLLEEYKDEAKKADKKKKFSGSVLAVKADIGA